MAIHPLGTLHIESNEKNRSVIEMSLDRIRKLGTRLWCGYSFSWFSGMLARCGQSEDALKYLELYVRAFILRNGFHVNGDQTRSGLSAFTYRPFTLEGDFLAMQAVHEMLLQSWGETIRVFPAVSERWRDASFERLRAEGGLKVSARRRDGRTTWVRVEATVDTALSLRDPFGGKRFASNKNNYRVDGNNILSTLKAGDAIELNLRE
jgi:alpha-L-fucosidase 2